MAAWLVTWLACLFNAHLMPTNPMYQDLCCVANIYKFIYVLSEWHSRYAMSIADKSRKAKAGEPGSCGLPEEAKAKRLAVSVALGFQICYCHHASLWAFWDLGHCGANL